jgi:hypothetical protein
MSRIEKNYKIILDSKPFGNIKGISPAEAAKKAASKILKSSSKYNFSCSFAIFETKTRKIWYYNAERKKLVNPYNKDGKIIKFRITVKKGTNYTFNNPYYFKKYLVGKLDEAWEREKLLTNGLNQENNIQLSNKKFKHEHILDIPELNNFSMNNPPNTQAHRDHPIWKFFPKELYYISYDNDRWEAIIMNKTEHKTCIHFNFTDNEANLNYLGTCGNDKKYSYSENLKRFIKFAKFLKKIDNRLSKIRLVDKSYIEIGKFGIPLYILDILTTGESFFNKIGFKSDNYEKEKKHNRKYLNMNFINFLKEVFGSNSYDNLLKKIYKLLHITNNKENITVKKVFQKIKEILKKYSSENSNGNIDLLPISDLFEKIRKTGELNYYKEEGIILYNKQLFLTL